MSQSRQSKEAKMMREIEDFAAMLIVKGDLRVLKNNHIVISGFDRIISMKENYRTYDDVLINISVSQNGSDFLKSKSGKIYEKILLEVRNQLLKENKTIESNELFEVIEEASYYIKLNDGVYTIEKDRNGKYVLVSVDDNTPHLVSYNFDYITDTIYTSDEVNKLIEWFNSLFHSEDDRDLFFTAVGSSLFPYKYLQHIYFQSGKGADGKSFLLQEIIIPFLIESRQKLSTTGDLAKLLDSNNKFALQNCDGKTLLYVDESPPSLKGDATLLKTISGSKRIEIEKKGLQSYEAMNMITAIINANELPILNDTGNSTKRRIRVIKYAGTMNKENHINIREIKKLACDGNNVFDDFVNWIFANSIKQYIKAINNGGAIETEATKEYIYDNKVEGSYVSRWILENNIHVESVIHNQYTDEVLARFKNDMEGEVDLKSYAKTKFTRMLKKHFNDKLKTKSDRNGRKYIIDDIDDIDDIATDIIQSPIITGFDNAINEVENLIKLRGLKSSSEYVKVIREIEELKRQHIESNKPKEKGKHSDIADIF